MAALPPHIPHHHRAGMQSLPMAVLPGVHALDVPVTPEPGNPWLPQASIELEQPGIGTLQKPFARKRYGGTRVPFLRGAMLFVLRWRF
jgi:hypothetical protein